MTIKRISGEELRNEYFVETRVKGYIYKDERQTRIESVTFTLRATRGQDAHLHDEDCVQLTYEIGCDRALWVYGAANDCEDSTALIEHFNSKTQEAWFAEAATLATEWANGESYQVADVDQRGLLIHGEDLIEIDA